MVVIFCTDDQSLSVISLAQAGKLNAVNKNSLTKVESHLSSVSAACQIKKTSVWFWIL